MKILPSTTKKKKTSCTVGNYQYTPSFGGKKILAKPIIDTCSFTHSDKTLEPKFLQNLLKLDNKNISVLQKYIKIKDEMLRAMGYKHPEELKLISVRSEGDFYAAYDAIQGKISVTDSNCSISKVISTLRHELEHLDQFAKIYKTMGENAFTEALTNDIKRRNPVLDSLEISINLNKNFYEIMSKDANTKNFDSKKYYEAMNEYTPFGYAISKAYKYFNNLLEKDAYSAERKILGSLGEEPIVCADAFPHNYKTLIKLMNDNNVPLQYQDNVFDVLRLAAQIKSIETIENFKKIWKIWVNKQKKIDIKHEEELLNQSLNKVTETYCSKVTLKQIELDKGCYNQIETWLRKGIWDFEEILNET